MPDTVLKLDIRTMRSDDLVTLSELEKCSGEWAWSPSSLQDSFSAGNHCVVCHRKEAMLGYAVLRQADVVVEILNFVIFRAHQRQCIGTWFLSHLISRFQERGAKEFWLEVRHDNFAARSLYERCGFSQSAVRKNYFRRGYGLADAILMARQIDDI